MFIDLHRRVHAVEHRIAACRDFKHGFAGVQVHADLVTLTQPTRIETVDQCHSAATTDHRHDRNGAHIRAVPQRVPLIFFAVPLEHRHAARGRASHAVEHGHVVAGFGEDWLVFGGNIVHHESMAVVHRH
ncbi:hypothetical protein D3C81_1728710 [compost metagenome]